MVDSDSSWMTRAKRRVVALLGFSISGEADIVGSADLVEESQRLRAENVPIEHDRCQVPLVALHESGDACKPTSPHLHLPGNGRRQAPSHIAPHCGDRWMMLAARWCRGLATARWPCRPAGSVDHLAVTSGLLCLARCRCLSASERIDRSTTGPASSDRG